MMHTLWRVGLSWTRSLRPFAVMLVPPRSKSLMNLKFLPIDLSPSSSILLHPSRSSFLRYLSWDSFAIPTSERFLHSESDRTFKPLRPPLARCWKVLSSVGDTNSVISVFWLLRFESAAFLSKNFLLFSWSSRFYWWMYSSTSRCWVLRNSFIFSSLKYLA